MKDDYPFLSPCKKCNSENLSIGGASWIQVWCNECSHKGQAFSYGTRCSRYNDAIEAWNEDSDQ